MMLDGIPSLTIFIGVAWILVNIDLCELVIVI